MKRLVLEFLNFKNIISNTLVLIVCTGCVNTPVLNNKTTTIPSWYLNTPVNNTLFIYGEGESQRSLEDAKNNALNSMASKLVVNVKSSISSTTETSSQNRYSKNIKRDIRVNVNNIKFTNASIEKSDKIANSFFVLMKVNRKELFTNKKKEFDIVDFRLHKKYNSLQNFSKLEQIHILQDIVPSIQKAQAQAVVLNAINNQFDQAPYMEKYDSYIDKISELKDSTTILIKTNSKKKYFADSLIDTLNQNNYKASYSANNSDVVISLNNKVKYSIARGWNIAKVTTTISVIANKKIISNQIIKSIGRSSTSKESALENASESFLRNIEKKTLDAVIFNK